MTMQDYTDSVIAQYEAVRRGGRCNMMDERCVERAARERGFLDLVRIIGQGRYAGLLEQYDADRASRVHDDFDFTGGGRR